MVTVFLQHVNLGFNFLLLFFSHIHDLYGSQLTCLNMTTLRKRQFFKQISQKQGWNNIWKYCTWQHKNIKICIIDLWQLFFSDRSIQFLLAYIFLFQKIEYRYAITIVNPVLCSVQNRELSVTLHPEPSFVSKLNLHRNEAGMEI